MKTKTNNKPNSLFLTDSDLGAATDLYQLTMAAGYLRNKMNNVSTFELWVRNLPDSRSFLVAAGLEQVLHYIENLSFSNEVIDYLRNHEMFKNIDDSFFKYLKDFQFSGDMFAAPEGSLIFDGEPILRVTAPLIEAQLVETYLLSTINFQTMITSKAARVVLAAKDCKVIDFGTRRAHGIQAGILAARACYIGGCVGTSNVFAGNKLGIPTMGTVAHSWIMATDDEYESFKNFHETFPDNTTLLIDTYDSVNGARLATKIGAKLKGVRIDSGDLSEISKEVRKVLDSAGMKETKIIASNDLNEYKIEQLLKLNSPIDIFGVGTEMVVSKDAPSLNCVYKLVEQEINGQIVPRVKLSKGKNTLPFKKQVFRVKNREGLFSEDIIGLDSEDLPQKNATRLLIPVVKSGKRCYELPNIEQIQLNAKNNTFSLPECYRNINHKKHFPVKKSNGLSTVDN